MASNIRQSIPLTALPANRCVQANAATGGGCSAAMAWNIQRKPMPEGAACRREMWRLRHRIPSSRLCVPHLPARPMPNRHGLSPAWMEPLGRGLASQCPRSMGFLSAHRCAQSLPLRFFDRCSARYGITVYNRPPLFRCPFSALTGGTVTAKAAYRGFFDRQSAH